MEMMSELAHRRQRAVVIVTHDSRVLNFADRMVRIEDGAIASNTEAQLVAPGVLAHNLPQAAVGLV
jgi:putative ABC transport system ATP-binding protein